MTQEESELWERIKFYQIGSVEAKFSFSDRLARENGWSLEFALRTMLEYKKFMFLICCFYEPLTPSDQVDQVWHLHLLYTQDYWNEFCDKVLGKQIHHGPTKGGKSEKLKFDDLYSNTLNFYRKKFGTEPPVDIWPSNDERFSKINFRRTSTNDFYLIPKTLKGLKKWIFSKN